MRNPIGIISMQFTRPFTNAALPYLQKTRELGFDFVELLVPEPEDGLDLAETRRILRGEGLAVGWAAAGQSTSQSGSSSPNSRQRRRTYDLPLRRRRRFFC